MRKKWKDSERLAPAGIEVHRRSAQNCEGIDPDTLIEAAIFDAQHRTALTSRSWGQLHRREVRRVRAGRRPPLSAEGNARSKGAGVSADGALYSAHRMPTGNHNGHTQRRHDHALDERHDGDTAAPHFPSPFIPVRLPHWSAFRRHFARAARRNCVRYCPNVIRSDLMALNKTRPAVALRKLPGRSSRAPLAAGDGPPSDRRPVGLKELLESLD
jgi:hypothetical protein